MSTLSTAKWDRRWRRMAVAASIICAIAALLALAAGQYPRAVYFAFSAAFTAWQYRTIRILHRHSHHYGQET